MSKRIILAAIAVVASAAAMTSSAGAVVPAYGSPGTANPATYSFTAATTGVVNAYFVGSNAGYDSLIGLRVNGGSLGGLCLPNHATASGTMCTLGSVVAGDTFELVLKVVNTGNFWSSSAASNAGGENHVYSAAYAGGDFGIPAGTYIGFEDLAGLGDRDYNDHEFVFTNVRGAVPEPASWAMLIAGFGLVGTAMRRRSSALAA